jgi:hypothetical protein
MRWPALPLCWAHPMGKTSQHFHKIADVHVVQRCPRAKEAIQGKEVNTMANYTKPRIVSTVEACTAVKSPEKMESFADNPDIGTVSAYEADE